MLWLVFEGLAALPVVTFGMRDLGGPVFGIFRGLYGCVCFDLTYWQPLSLELQWPSPNTET